MPRGRCPGQESHQYSGKLTEEMGSHFNLSGGQSLLFTCVLKAPTNQYNKNKSQNGQDLVASPIRADRTQGTSELSAELPRLRAIVGSMLTEPAALGSLPCSALRQPHRTEPVVWPVVEEGESVQSCQPKTVSLQPLLWNGSVAVHRILASLFFPLIFLKIVTRHHDH